MCTWQSPLPTAGKRRSAVSRHEYQLSILSLWLSAAGAISSLFLKIGKILKENYGHSVRIATHPTFKTFVEKDIGLEFFSVGGDPSELMASMVKNPGLIPKMETVKAGEIGRRRDSMYEMFQRFWRACINATDDEKDVANLKMMGAKYPFVADAIIANPPSFAHFHCAEKLGVPLHLVFTFPYTPTQSFPHPLANMKASNVDENYTNFMSYPPLELMTWQGLGDLVNKFRTKALGLEPLSTLWAPGQLSRLQVPFTYLWSPSLVPNPKDWGPEIDIAGSVFLDLASSFKPAESLARFLDTQSEKPLVYVGFGSISGI
jgi:UDP:flavonoid glycosyltransferase YjiC (YdhE family)